MECLRFALERNMTHEGDGQRHSNVENDEDEEDLFVSQDDVLEVIELADQQQNGGPDNGENEGSADDEEAAEASGNVEPAEVIDNSMATFSRHTGEVYSVDLTSVYGASGGEDDRAYVWKLDGELIFECRGHTDSVTYVRFNARGTMLATACIAGHVQVWRTSDFAKVGELEVGDLTWLKWHHAADIVFCGSEDGSSWMFLVPNGSCKVYAGYGPSCTAGELFPDGKRLCTGYADGGVRLWDLKTSTFTNVEGASVHKGSVTCVDISQDGTLAASGSEEGTVNLIHANSGKIIASFVCAAASPVNRHHQTGDDGERMDTEESNEETVSVEAVAFSKTSPLLFTGTVNGEMAIWDLNTHVVRQTLPTREGVVKATWIDNCVLVADLGGTMSMYDSRNGELVTKWTGHKGAVLDFNLSKDSKTLISCSADHTCKVFQIDIGNR